MVEKDYFAAGEEKIDLFTVMAKARTIIDQRNLEQKEGSDGWMESGTICGCLGRPIWKIRV